MGEILGRDTNAAEEKRSEMEERLKRVMEQNRLPSTTNVELDSRIRARKAENEELQAKIDKLRAKLLDQEDSLIFKKTYAMYHMKRKTLEEAKGAIANINDCIAKARELELIAREKLHARPATSDSSNTNFVYLGTEGDTEEDEGPEPAAE
ncbi:tropomyosin-2-like [Nicotiana tomentosiformis]|uniref:tropomyosin-2-like n=1 Tax=Nicotiana tomentosiformis TaxID=4098 RepID=UPI00388CB7D3